MPPHPPPPTPPPRLARRALQVADRMRLDGVVTLVRAWGVEGTEGTGARRQGYERGTASEGRLRGAQRNSQPGSRALPGGPQGHCRGTLCSAAAAPCCLVSSTSISPSSVPLPPPHHPTTTTPPPPPPSPQVDAKHVEQHLDEEKPEGVVNEAVEQIAYADRIVLNKTDLVGAGCCVLRHWSASVILGPGRVALPAVCAGSNVQRACARSPAPLPHPPSARSTPRRAGAALFTTHNCTARTACTVHTACTATGGAR